MPHWTADIFRHYGTDWLAMGLSMLGLYLLGNKRKEGFIAMLLGNASWAAMGFMVGSWAMIGGNIILLVVNLRGFMRWLHGVGRAT